MHKLPISVHDVFKQALKLKEYQDFGHNFVAEHSNDCKFIQTLETKLLHKIGKKVNRE